MKLKSIPLLLMLVAASVALAPSVSANVELPARSSPRPSSGPGSPKAWPSGYHVTAWDP